MLSHIWTRAAAGASAVALAAGLTAAPDAAAQTQPVAVGQCVTPAVLSAQLKAEGQKIIYTGLRNGIFKNPQGREYVSNLGMNATSTLDGKKGYIIHECSDDIGKANGLIKVATQVENVRLYRDDISKPDPSMLVAASLKDGLDACAKSVRATCEPHNTVISKIYNRGGHVPYQAFSPAANKIIFISVVNKTGLIHLTEPTSGASTAYGGGLFDPRYSKFAVEVGKTIPVQEDRLAAAPSGLIAAVAPR